MSVEEGYRPPARRRNPTGLITAAVLAVLIAIAVVVTLVELSSSGTVKSQLGASSLTVGRDTVLADEVARSGPVLLPDLAGKNRPVYLQHLGPDPAKGWVGIQALLPGEAPKCVLSWDSAAHRFRDPCSTLTYPEDGSGLTRYPVTVLPSRRINLDLRAALPAGVTVTTGTAPPSR